MGWPAIQGYKNGEEVVMGVLNRPLMQLAQRTEYLRQRLADNDRTKVTVVGAFPENAVPSRGKAVVCAGEDGTFEEAAADTAQNAWFYAGGGAMAVGVVGNTDPGRTGDPDHPKVDPPIPAQTRVVLYGRIDFARDPDPDDPNDSGDPGIPVKDLIVDAGTSATGRYYLAPETPDPETGLPRRGMLTQHPNGPVIYIANCIIKDGYVTAMLVNPQYRDTGESHVHREIVVSGLPLKGKASRSWDDTTSKWTYTSAVCIYPDVQPGVQPSGAGLVVAGTWISSDPFVYTVKYEGGRLSWSVTRPEETEIIASGTAEIDGAWYAKIGPDTHGDVYVHLVKPQSAGESWTPSDGETWTLNLPADGRAWVKCPGGFKCNLGFYGDTGFVPAVPNNAAALVVDGLELRSARYGSDKQWDFLTGEQLPGGPWVLWAGDTGAADNVVTPFRNDAWTASGTGEKTVDTRFISFHTNRMMVGPTGFVTSLQVEPGSPLRITDALSGSSALQGALMLGLALDFDTVAHGVAGSEVVKRITGSKFETGPVVERIVAGDDSISISGNGQGVVTLGISNAHYAGDFETIALKNAKQDVAGGIFPYTKLLGWTAAGPNVQSGFTAKFRVPDYIPYGTYNVVVSASVFGEKSEAFPRHATFSVTNYVCADHALVPDSTEASAPVSSLTPGATAVVPVILDDGYSAFDPILVHGMAGIDDIANQRQYNAGMLLKNGAGAPVTVKPGYFVGLAIARCGFPAGSDGVLYESPIGFLSLRWNLVKVQGGAA